MAKNIPNQQVDWHKAHIGDVDAQFHLGWSFFTGTQDIPQNLEAAAAWFKLASDQGHEQASEMLGEMLSNVGPSYEHGSESLSIMYYCKYRDSLETKAQSGDVVAQFNVAGLFLGGATGDPQIDRAIYWYQQAAENGSHQACHALAHIYTTGWYCSADQQLADTWLLKANELSGNQLE